MISFVIKLSDDFFGVVQSHQSFLWVNGCSRTTHMWGLGRSSYLTTWGELESEVWLKGMALCSEKDST